MEVEDTQNLVGQSCVPVTIMWLINPDPLGCVTNCTEKVSLGVQNKYKNALNQFNNSLNAT